MIFKELVKAKQRMMEFAEIYENGSHHGYSLYDEYLALSRFFQNLFISDGEWIVDTGNFQTVNYAMMDMVFDRIKKHPLLWKIFFMIA